MLGPAGNPTWARPALVGLLVATACLYLWGLGASGWANTFYSAAVQAGAKSWKAMFFGASDAAGSITVDKPPASLWVMEVSARVFGLSSWSILVPEALEGVAAVGVLYATVKRWFGAGAGLIAGAVLALTPVAVLMFRFNNPDALLVLLLVAGAYAMTRAVESGRTGWLVAAGALVGVGFITKMLQALLVVPAFALMYLWAGPPNLGRRVVQLLAAGAALIVSSLWWVVAVMAVPASSRPYIGGSTDNSLWNLIFGYNGFGRVTGNETGSVGGGAAGQSGRWGPTGWLRLFNSSFGGQISWLLPAALVLFAGGLLVTVRARRTDRSRAFLLLWGGWLAVTGLTFSLSKGIIHPYYTVALAPAVAALVAGGAAIAWSRRARWAGRALMAASVAGTSVWAYVLLGRTPHWLPWLRDGVLGLGLAAAVALLVWGGARLRIAAATAVAAVVIGLAAPAAYALNTARTVHSSAIPSAGPTVVGTGGGPGGGGPGRGGPGGGGALPTGATAATTGARAAFAGTPPPGAAFGGTGGAGAGGGVGGILTGSTASSALVEALDTNASRYTWVAATVSSNQAAGYQLATGHSVMPIGGFNGTDPSPTLAQFERWVAEGRVHYFIAAGGGAGGIGGGGIGGGGSSSGTAAAITSWVESHYTAKTIGGTTVYDLTPAKA